MLTKEDIESLIKTPKKIKKKTPAKEYKEENGHKRCDLEVSEDSVEDGKTFSVFIRQNIYFIENFSIGLCYKTKNRALSSITLIRYNGPHGTSQSHGGHYSKPHIH